jgi:2-iminobutanoate/2-iminopropanoate deaminase
MEKVYTKHAPEAIGPYSQAIKLGNLVFSSGQIPVDPATGAVVSGGFEQQSEQVMKNLAAVLEAAGSSLDKVVKTTCFITSMDDFAVFNKVYAAYITNAPARSCVEVSSLPKGVSVEVEAIAAL